jgi:hypothetical protein
MWKTGHSLVKAKLKETGAPLAGEMSGHIFFRSAGTASTTPLYTAARMLEILTKEQDPSALLNALPQSDSTPELHLHLAEGENFLVMDKLRADAEFPGNERIITIDGLRVEYADGFGLARSSNTTPVIVLRFEGRTSAAIFPARTSTGWWKRAMSASCNSIPACATSFRSRCGAGARTCATRPCAPRSRHFSGACARSNTTTCSTRRAC